MMIRTLLLLLLVLAPLQSAEAQPAQPPQQSAEIMQIAQMCIGCELVAEMLLITESYGEKVFNTLQRGMLNLIGISLVLWLLYHAARLFTPFSPLAEFTNLNNMVVSRIGITLLVCLFMGTFLNFWNYIYTPIVLSGIQAAGTLVNSAAEIAGNTGAVQKYCGNFAFTTADGETMKKAMECLMGSMQETVGNILVGSLFAIFSTFSWFNPFTAFTTLFGGLIIVWQFGKIYLTLPFRVADVVIRWTVLSVLSPIIVAAFILPGTRNLTFTAIRGMVQSALELLLVGLILALTSAVVMQLQNQILAAQAGPPPADPFEVMQKAFTDTALGTDVFWQFFIIGMITNLLLRQVSVYSDALLNPTQPNARIDTNVGSGVANAADGLVEQGRAAGTNAATGAVGNAAANRGLRQSIAKAPPRAP